jgi:hypothetical protein
MGAIGSANDDKSVSATDVKPKVSPTVTVKKPAAKPDSNSTPCSDKPVPLPPKGAHLSGYVQGWDYKALVNASIIVNRGIAHGMPTRGCIIGLMTAMQESNLHNIYSSKVAGSKDYPNDGEGHDHTSVGLFQQQNGWRGLSLAQRMNPAASADGFYKELQKVIDGHHGWKSNYVKYTLETYIAQEVQDSGHPDYYQKWKRDALKVLAYLLALRK